MRKTILDVLLEQNRLTPTEAADFDKDLNNTQIEQKLRAEQLVSSEDIAKAYAVVYDLPFIRLENYQILPEAFNAIPKELIERYKILAFEKIGEHKVKIALGSPAELRRNPSQILDEIKEKKGISADLYLTTPEDIKRVLERFAESADRGLLPSDNKLSAEVKTVDLAVVKIPYEIISKFPIEISRKYKMVVFDNPTPNLIKVAVSDPYDPKVQEILDFVRQKNEIAIEEFVASPAEIDEAIKIFYQKPIVPLPPPPAGPPPPASGKPPLPFKPSAKEEFTPAGFWGQKPAITISPKEEQTAPRPTFVRRPAEAQTLQAAPPQTEEEEQAVPVTAPEADLDKFLGFEVKTIEAFNQVAQSGNVPHILAAAVALAVYKKASDIHIEPEEGSLRIRFRIDGVLQDVIKLPLELQPPLISRVKILSRLKIDEQRIPQDGRFDARTHGHEIDLRVSTLPTVRGEKAALRILDKSQNIYTLEELGLAGRNLKILEENIVKPFGVILATGPTGSGKSTTLYSILKKIASSKVNVITLEDPVEYEIPGINQCQVKPKIGFSFAEGLRSVLRQDPNIIMVGEIRDAETAGMATHAALTGHLVLSTLHTNDAAGSLPRLINMGVEPFLITSSINAIIGQRLVRKVCPKCRKEAKLPEPMLRDIEKELGRFNLPQPYRFYDAVGCPECSQGYSGRIGIYEVLAMSEKIELLAIQRRPASEILSVAVSEGMITMKQDGLIKAVKGITTVSEVLRVTSSG